MSEVFVAPPQLLSAVSSPGAGGEAERAARSALRAQIARLERELSAALVEVFTMRGRAAAGVGHPPLAAAPRLLDLGELERVRDELAHRLAGVREDIGRQRDGQREARARLERMRLAPGHHRFHRIALRELGAPGCGAWYVAPRMGLIGMMMDWWELKLSSGCPLCR